MGSISENFRNCQERIDRAAARCGRETSGISIVAVTKTVDPVRINEGIVAGITIIGENKVQEARDKKDLVNPVRWHMVGHLQTNKVKHAVRIFDMIQSVDSFHLAQEINDRCEKVEQVMPILIEVNTSGESSKYGCHPDNAIDLLGQISQLKNVRIEGLMTIGLLTDDQQQVRPCFQRLRRIAENARALPLEGVNMRYLSMGMSSDFETAIEEGSNMVRIGTAIFGPRN